MPENKGNNYTVQGTAVKGTPETAVGVRNETSETVSVTQGITNTTSMETTTEINGAVSYMLYDDKHSEMDDIINEGERLEQSLIEKMKLGTYYVRAKIGNAYSEYAKVVLEKDASDIEMEIISQESKTTVSSNAKNELEIEESISEPAPKLLPADEDEKTETGGLKTDDTAEKPKTGDNSNAGWYLILVTVSLAGIAAIIVYRKKSCRF